MTWLDWALLVLVTEVIIILIPLTLTVVALLRANLPPEPPEPPEPVPPPTEPGVVDSSILKVLSQNERPYEMDIMDSQRFTINTPGAYYENWRFDREVDVKAPNVMFYNCWFAGAQVGGRNTGLVRCITKGASFQADRCTVKPDHPNDGPDGVRGSNFTLTWCDISGTVDGLHIYGDLKTYDDPAAGHVTVSDSWLHDFVWYNNTSHSDGTHNDCVQVVGGTRIGFHRNWFSGTAYNAVFMLQQNENKVGDLTIEDCVFESNGKTTDDGSQYTISGVNLDDSRGPEPIRGLVIRRNQFVKGAQKYPLLISGRTLDAGAIVEDNTYADGSEVQVLRGA